MKKCIKRVVSSCLLLFTLFTGIGLTTISACAEENNEQYIYDGRKLSNDYYIKDMDVVIDVYENNMFHITETYEYDFVKAHHGMTRDITLNHVRYYENGEEQYVEAKIKKFKCNEKVARTESGQHGKRGYVIKYMGDEDKEIKGLKDYVISYDYYMNTETPELYYNIVGTGWSCPIGHVSFTINMPKDFDSSKIGFSVGEDGATGYNEELLKWQCQDNVITGEYLGILDSGEGLTIRSELPEGYFDIPDYSFFLNLSYVIVIALAAPALLMISRRRWFTAKVTNFYPPDGLNPLDCERIYESRGAQKVIALLPYLANKGYIAIEETQDLKHKTKAKQYRFRKLDSNYNRLKDDEALFMSGMFGCKETVTQNSLEDKFYLTISKIRAYSSEVAKGLYEPESIRLSRIAFLTSGFAISWTNLYKSIFVFDKFNTLLLACLSIALSVMLYYLIKTREWFAKIFLAFFLFVFVVMIISVGETTDIIGVAVVALGCFATTCKRRTDEEQAIYEEVLGYRNFMKYAQADKLRMLVHENPDYFYDSLGYAYAFGLEKKWFKKFESLGIMPDYCPVWFPNDMDNFNPNTFSDTFRQCMTSNNSSLSSSPSSSGGDSGGGCSGGGSGGGGGGAW